MVRTHTCQKRHKMTTITHMQLSSRSLNSCSMVHPYLHWVVVWRWFQLASWIVPQVRLHCPGLPTTGLHCASHTYLTNHLFLSFSRFPFFPDLTTNYSKTTPPESTSIPFHHFFALTCCNASRSACLPV